ncbi:MAG: glycosyltransferase family 4 protein [Candidatus Bathyarchaeota archaeon]|nr:glycosyltransferase family 4 protein [Candidatus Bathyarchaeum tardum]
MGGVEIHVEEISKRLVRNGFDVDVLTVDNTGSLSNEIIRDGVKIKRFKGCRPCGLNDVFYFSADLDLYLKKNSSDYDIIHAQNYHAFPAFYASQNICKNKFVFTPHYHGAGSYFVRNLLHIPYKFLGGKIFENAEIVFCVSDYERNLVLSNFGVDNDKIRIVPNGFDFDDFTGNKLRNKSNTNILYVGRLEKYKGIHYIFEAFPSLDDEVNIEIVGIGPYENELKKLATRLGIEDRVNFYHSISRDRLLKKYSESGLFVLLSIRESYGITVGESLLSGTPCLVLNSSALREWVDNKNCFGIDYPVNVKRLAIMISKIIGTTVDYEEVKNKVLSWDDVTKKIIETYAAI